LWAIDYATLELLVRALLEFWGGRDKMRELCSPETQFIRRLTLIDFFTSGAK